MVAFLRLTQGARTSEEMKPSHIYFFPNFDVGELIKGYFLALIHSILAYLYSETS